nr:hypothetical protein [Tanacetum cinerariifolium]
MATTIEQQVTLDEALVPSAQRNSGPQLRFINTPSDSKWTPESTLSIWKHLGRCCISVLGSSAAVINKCLTGKSSGIDSLRLSQAQILWGLYHRRNVDYAFLIWEDFVYQVEHKNQKKSNEMYYPRFTKVIIHHFMTRKPSIPRRNKVNWHYVRDDILLSTIKMVSRHQNTQQYGAILPIELTTEDIRNTKAYKEYYACATGEAAPKPKASARRKRGGFDTSTTPPTPIATPTPITTVVAAPRLTAATKGKQPARATSPTDPTEVERTESEQLKIVLRRSRQETHISQHGSLSTYEGTGSKPGVPDVPSDDSDKEISWNSFDDEDVDAQESGGDDEETESDGESEQEKTREEEEESFNPIPRTPEDSENDGNGEEDQGMESIFTASSSFVTPIPSPTSTMTPSIITTTTTASQPPIPSTPIPSEVLQNLPTFELTDQLQDSFQRKNDEFLRTIDDNMKKIIKEQVKSQVKAQVTRILPRIKESVNAQLEAEVLTRSSHSSRTSYAVALVDAYEADKTILDSYGESSILKRRREDDDDQEGPSIGSDRGSKRQREGREHASASTSYEPATRSAGRSTTGTQSRQMSASAEDQPIVQTSQYPKWFSEPRKSPTPDRDWNKTLPAVQGSAQSWISELAKQADAHSSFNELLDTLLDFSNFIMNRLGVNTLTPELLAGPTYELMRGSCNSLTELEYHLEEVYKAMTDQLHWDNPEGQQYPHNLLQPFLLIPDNRGRRVIPFAHFINNDLEYLRGGASSRKYTTSVTKTKAADYGHIKWIEDLVPRTIYQKRLNLTKPDTYRSDLKRREAYTAYSNPRGFIYQNKDKKNRLMQIDELQKFSDGTLNDVRNALDDRLKGIRMQYLPTTIWRKGDKDRAAAMIQAIDKMLKTRGL